MGQYMVTLELPVPFTNDFVLKIPEQRQVINNLMAEQKIQSYSLSMNRERLWCLINAESEFEVIRILDMFPLIQEMPYEISELMFHNVATIHVPAFSLN